MDNEVPVSKDGQQFDYDAEIRRVEACMANLGLIPCHVPFVGDRFWIGEAISLLAAYADDLSAQAERE